MLAIAMIGIGQIAFAQKNFKEVEKFYLLQRITEARKELDKALANPELAGKPEAQLWKTRIYAELYSSDSSRALNPTAGDVAFEAFNKYKQMEPELKEIKEPQGRRPILIVYNGFLNEGSKMFKDEKWRESYEFFKKAEELGDFIIKSGFSSAANPATAIDTGSVLYAGVAAQNANLNDEAAKYFRKYVDQRIAGPNDIGVYAYLLEYFTKNKNEAEFQKYLALATEVYPKETDRWNYFKNKYTSANLNPKEIIERYKQEDAGGKLTADQYGNYGSLLGFPSKDKQESLDSATFAEMKHVGAEAFKKAFALSNYGIDAYHAGALYYLDFNTLEDRYKANVGVAAALKAKREAIEKESHVVVDSAIVWLTKAYDALKSASSRDKIESATLNKTVDMLAIMYGWKRDKSKVKAPKDFDKYDKLYKKFDSEHSKY